MPKAHVEGIATFRISPELSGTSYIRSSSGYTSRVDYSSKGWFRGESNSFVAKLFKGDDERHPIYLLEGSWSGVYTVKDRNGVIIEKLDLEALRRTPLRVAPLEEQHPLESRRAWQHVVNAINENDIFAVGHEKGKIENEQRELRKKERAAGTIWGRRYFTKFTVDPTAARVSRATGHDMDAEADDMIWKFDEMKYKRTMGIVEEALKNPPPERPDSGIALVDDSDEARLLA